MADFGSRKTELTIMFLLHKTFLVPLSFLMASSYCQAATILVANLTNAQENPPTTPTTTTGAPRPASSGTATFVLNDAMTAMTMSVTVSNLDFTGSQTPDSNDNLVAAHIHASPTASLTVNAPVVWGFFGSPFNDNNPNDTVVTPFSSGVGGTITGKWDAPEGNNTILADQLANILSGHSYINFHTVQFGGGETRGFLQAVPEPSAVLLLSVGFVSLLGIGMQGRRKTGRQ
jgi:hypothetical protein